MSWRDILGGDAPPTHNSHNTQNTHQTANSANNANCAEQESKLLEELATACQNLSITPKEVKEALAPDDAEAWRKGEIAIEALTAFAHALSQRKEMDQGKRPATYTHPATCKHCGPIWLWFSGEVLGCPWCWNQANDKPIPRPYAVTCVDCKYFKRINHPNIGHCLKGEPEAVAGLWDTDQSYCERYYPKTKQGD